jgi:hypothetical protein
MIDIDKFKSINDGYGHLAGDNALKEVAQRVEAQIRSMDTAARFGGDELAILLPEAGAAEAASWASAFARSSPPYRLRSRADRAQFDGIGGRRGGGSPGRHDCWRTRMRLCIGPRRWAEIACRWERVTDLKAVADRLIAERGRRVVGRRGAVSGQGDWAAIDFRAECRSRRGTRAAWRHRWPGNPNPRRPMVRPMSRSMPCYLTREKSMKPRAVSV